ncbi:hypothetical protein EJA72_29445 [Pseudomonas sp. PB120]|uniref:glycosyltransferase n=1 Tax=Pseudomonas sp. PB120 TaxID=2494700 RepID=UPI0012FE1246|nr:glycosyltransferase [Pseudomonas sp. PB120]MVV52325.1 hypothetical protein [Pseudomonas sp. PB120]
MSDSGNRALRILITNNSLAGRAGSELYVRDLAIALMKRGHHPIAYSSQLGEVAEELRRATVPVIDDLRALNSPPDIIHGQHHLDAVTAMLHFPLVPALYICHGWLPWQELPPVMPGIGRYVAVDDLCRERLLITPGIDPQRIEVLYNFVDLERFKPRAALPKRPKSALIFSNYADDQAITAFRNACQQAGIEKLDVVGSQIGNAATEPAKLLGQYDLVFAKARAALEAMACGCAVVVADQVGLAGMVDTRNLAELRRLNFGVRSMQRHTLSEENILREIQRYDSADAQQVSHWIREDADMEKVVERWLQIYDDLRAEAAATARQPADRLHDQLRAGSAYLRWLTPTIKGRDQQVEARIQELERLVDHSQQQQAILALQAEATARDLMAITGSRTWRALGHYRKLRKWLRKG